MVDSPAAGAIGIYTSAGAFVASYFTPSTSSDPNAVDVTRCGSGVCVLGSSSSGYSVTYASKDGAAHAILPATKNLVPVRIAADRIGPVFLVGPSNTMLEALNQVVVQLAPAPP